MNRLVNIKPLVMVAVLGLMTAACNNYDTLEELGRKMQELEGQKIEKLDSNITVVQKLIVLAEEQDYITNIVPNADSTVWTLTFASHPDHPEVVAYGKDGKDGHTPEVTVAYDPVKGKWFWVIDGEPTSMEAKGQDGHEMTVEEMKAVVPLFRVNDQGNWEMSTDQGKTWTPVTDSYGKAVSAKGKNGEEDKWIESVSISPDGKTVTIIIKQPDGKTYSLSFPYRLKT